MRLKPFSAVAFFILLLQFEAVRGDEIPQYRGEYTGLLEAFDLNSQAIKLKTKNTNRGYLQPCIRGRDQTIWRDVHWCVTQREAQTKKEKAACGGRPSSLSITYGIMVLSYMPRCSLSVKCYL